MENSATSVTVFFVNKKIQFFIDPGDTLQSICDKVLSLSLTLYSCTPYLKQEVAVRKQHSASSKTSSEFKHYVILKTMDFTII